MTVNLYFLSVDHFKVCTIKNKSLKQLIVYSSLNISNVDKDLSS